MTKLWKLSAKICWQKAKALKQLGSYKEALNSLEKSLEVFTVQDVEFREVQSFRVSLIDNVANEYRTSGSINALIKKYEDALIDYNQAISLKPDSVESYYLRGLCYHSSGHIQAAITDLNHVLKLNPYHEDGYKSLAVLFHDTEDYQRALENINEAIRLKSDESELYAIRASIRYSLKDYQRGIDDCNKTLSLQQDNYDAYRTRGDIYEALKDYQAAIEDYTRSLNIEPKQSDTFINRGTAFLRLNNICRSLEDFTEAINLDPESALAYENLGIALCIVEDDRDEVADYRQVAKNFSKAAELYAIQGNKTASQDMALRAKEVKEYAKLRSLLATQKWREADDETARAICRAAGVEHKTHLNSSEIFRIPAEDLLIIDNLWLLFSEEHFGFSIQQRFWEATEGVDMINKRFYAFAHHVGWGKDRWLSWSELTYKSNAPKGHLPSGKFRSETSSGFWGGWEEFFTHAKNCGL